MNERKTVTRPPDETASRPAPRRDVDAFLEALKSRPAPRGKGRGRLVFSLDATISRRPTWDRASTIQGDMFAEAAGLGGLEVQLVWFRGFRECRASRWTADGATLARLMSKVDCRGGETQIGRVLRHILKETERAPVAAAVHVGDACEEPPDPLCRMAGELGLSGVPLFFFLEGGDPVAAAAFGEMARLSGGACVPFDGSSPRELADLLRAVAAYAAGGRAALEHHAGASSAGRLLLENMGGGR